MDAVWRPPCGGLVGQWDSTADLPYTVPWYPAHQHRALKRTTLDITDRLVQDCLGKIA